MLTMLTAWLLDLTLPAWLWTALIALGTFLGYTEEAFEGGEE